MSAEEFTRIVNEFRRQVPYCPFAVLLVNGVRVKVDRPDAIVVRAGVGAYLGPGGIPVLFDHEGITGVIPVVD